MFMVSDFRQNRQLFAIGGGLDFFVVDFYTVFAGNAITIDVLPLRG